MHVLCNAVTHMQRLMFVAHVENPACAGNPLFGEESARNADSDLIISRTEISLRRTRVVGAVADRATSLADDWK